MGASRGSPSEMLQCGPPLLNPQNSFSLEPMSSFSPPPANEEASSPVVLALKFRRELKQLMQQSGHNVMHVGDGILYSNTTSNWQMMGSIEISGMGLVDGAASVAHIVLCRLPSSIFMRA